MYIIGFNGPPHSGKDTIADSLAALIEDTCGIESQPLRCALSQPMRETIYALLGENYSQNHYEANKDKPQPLLNGSSIRQAMIGLSEGFVKPGYGQDFWAKACDLNYITAWLKDTTIISDFGFKAEVDYFDSTYPTLVVELEREGTDWSKDSRGYVGSHALHFLRVLNQATPQWAAQEILSHMTSRLGWTF